MQTDKTIEQLFLANSDCYADNWRVEQVGPNSVRMREGNVTPAMTQAKFEELVKPLRDEIEALKKEREWISVKDRLPETDLEDVIIGWEGSASEVGSYRDGCFFDSGDYATRPTHWLPFLVPPVPGQLNILEDEQ